MAINWLPYPRKNAKKVTTQSRNSTTAGIGWKGWGYPRGIEPSGHFRRNMMMLILMNVYCSTPDRIEKVIAWLRSAMKAKASAIGSRKRIEGWGGGYFGCTAENQPGR